jgi:hypothetical protein
VRDSGIAECMQVRRSNTPRRRLAGCKQASNQASQQARVFSNGGRSKIRRYPSPQGHALRHKRTYGMPSPFMVKSKRDIVPSLQHQAYCWGAVR